MKSFLAHLQAIGDAIKTGIAVATPFVGAFDPALGPILSDVAELVTGLEAKGKPMDPAALTQLVSAVAIAQTVKQGLAKVSAS